MVGDFRLYTGYTKYIVVCPISIAFAIPEIRYVGKAVTGAVKNYGNAQGVPNILPFVCSTVTEVR